ALWDNRYNKYCRASLPFRLGGIPGRVFRQLGIVPVSPSLILLFISDEALLYLRSPISFVEYPGVYGPTQ
ncbi:Hypothetical predicted protein, partial [Pelobates cultripes]